ncbi:MAG: UDP-N-acetylmuramoyl-L-alanyl-D-glutamate--2,6-diaminopimelate ligase [Spirochaetota bacterium]
MKSDILQISSGDLVTLVRDDATCEIEAVTYDSRRAKKGTLFVAVTGYKADGHDFAENAYQNGCRHFLVATGRADELSSFPDISVFETDNSRRALSNVSALCYGEVTKEIPVIGITGTNGKTSITYMIESVLKEAGYVPGVIGTVNYRWDDIQINAPNTTPESSDLHEILARMHADGVDVVVMEVSSHALSLGRVDDVHFSIAVFTNLTQDHLDFHPDLSDYFSAKKRLFELLAKSESRTGINAAIINTDDQYGSLLFDEISGSGMNVYSLSTRAGSMYHIMNKTVQTRLDGLSYNLEVASSRQYEIDLHLSARFNVYNSAVAFAVCHLLDIDEDDIVGGLSSITHVPGRFDRVSSSLGFHVIIDYAHTEDALVKLLLAARELGPTRLITVFGCGGDRDRKKRPLMGKAAVTNSDLSIITSDNPRTENPGAIIEDILKGIASGDGEWKVIENREDAIREAVGMAEEGNLIVIAGKGHEDYQILGTEKIHFDDKEIVQKYVSEREEA